MAHPAPLDPQTARVLPWLVAIAFFMQTLDGTILNTALPAMARDLAEDPLRMQGVVIAYMLTVALLIPASGWLADRFGTRRTFFGAIVLFTLGSLFGRHVDKETGVAPWFEPCQLEYDFTFAGIGKKGGY